MDNYQEIMKLKEKIILIGEEIIKECEDFKTSFKKRNFAIKNGSTKTLQIDLISSALFGNGIIT
jgi:hypothetical protein